MKPITMRQAHAVLRDMGFYNMAESYAERDEKLMAKWKKPGTIVKRDDEDLERLRRYFGITPANIDLLFKKASEKPGGPPSAGLIISEKDMGDSVEPTPKWLTLARSYLGTKEVPGLGASKSNPKINDFFKDAGFPGIYDDTSWCAAFVSAVMKRSGYPVLADLTARSARHYGVRLKKPKIGCIVVFWRESPNSWKGHVGFVTGINHATKTLKVLGGNQSDAVTESTYPMSRVLDYRWPVAPTIKALKKSGSSEAKKSEVAKTVGVGVTVVGVANEVAKDPSILPEIGLTEIDAVKAIVDRLADWFQVLSTNNGVLLIVVGVVTWYIATEWQKNRIERAKRGFPILEEDIKADKVLIEELHSDV
jgi:uncharacterized protein (TIGR02594 family)